MATSKPGITAAPPRRVGAGMYVDANNKPVAPPKGAGSAPTKAQSKAPTYKGLNANQSAVINQKNTADQQLGQVAQAQMPSIQQNFSQPLDTNQLPQTPWSQGQSIQDMSTDYYNKALGSYNRSMQDQYKQQDTDFEQQMANRAIPLGSDLYNNLKAQTQKSRDAAEQNAMDSAYSGAAQNATTWNNLGNQNFQNAYTYAQSQRNQPLADYANITAAQSGMPAQNLGYSQQQGLAQQAGQIAKSMPHGGGGSQPIWQQYGFSSPAEYDAYQTNQQRDQQQWMWNNAPQGAQPPSYTSQLGGGILGSIASGWAMGGFKGL